MRWFLAGKAGELIAYYIIIRGCQAPTLIGTPIGLVVPRFIGINAVTTNESRDSLRSLLPQKHGEREECCPAFAASGGKFPPLAV
jgi:hypothetical protein